MNSLLEGHQVRLLTQQSHTNLSKRDKSPSKRDDPTTTTTAVPPQDASMNPQSPPGTASLQHQLSQDGFMPANAAGGQRRGPLLQPKKQTPLGLLPSLPVLVTQNLFREHNAATESVLGGTTGSRAPLFSTNSRSGGGGGIPPQQSQHLRTLSRSSGPSKTPTGRPPPTREAQGYSSMVPSSPPLTAGSPKKDQIQHVRIAASSSVIIPTSSMAAVGLDGGEGVPRPSTVMGALPSTALMVTTPPINQPTHHHHHQGGASSSSSPPHQFAYSEAVWPGTWGMAGQPKRPTTKGAGALTTIEALSMISANQHNTRMSRGGDEQQQSTAVLPFGDASLGPPGYLLNTAQENAAKEIQAFIRKELSILAAEDEQTQRQNFGSRSAHRITVFKTAFRMLVPLLNPKMGEILQHIMLEYDQFLIDVERDTNHQSFAHERQRLEEHYRRHYTDAAVEKERELQEKIETYHSTEHSMVSKMKLIERQLQTAKEENQKLKLQQNEDLERFSAMAQAVIDSRLCAQRAELAMSEIRSQWEKVRVSEKHQIDIVNDNVEMAKLIKAHNIPFDPRCKFVFDNLLGDNHTKFFEQSQSAASASAAAKSALANIEELMM